MTNLDSFMDWRLRAKVAIRSKNETNNFMRFKNGN